MVSIWAISKHGYYVHLFEEVSNASTAVPIAILMLVCLYGILRFKIFCVFAACIHHSSGYIDVFLIADLPAKDIIEEALNTH